MVVSCRRLLILAALLVVGCGDTSANRRPLADLGTSEDADTTPAADTERNADDDTVEPDDTTPSPDTVDADVAPSDTAESTDTVDSDAGVDTVEPADTVEPDTAPQPTFVTATNPVLEGDHPDPHVLRQIASDGKPIYYLTHTVHNAGDIPIYESRDLIHWTKVSTVFGRTRQSGHTLDINEGHFCSIWAPELIEVRTGVYMVTFSAQRFTSARSCPSYGEDGGVYVASSSSPTGPYAVASRPWEPLAAGGHITDCPASTRNAIPRSLNVTSGDCQGTYCHHIIRLDSTVWRDPETNRWWMGYAWYTNTPPLVDWERNNHGEHVNLVELDADDPFTVKCDTNVAQIAVANPHDDGLRSALASYCDGCDQKLAFNRNRNDQVHYVNGYEWGVAEGPSMFRRGDWIYTLLSGSIWDSSYYHVFFVAAKTVGGLRQTAPRIVGRYLIPGDTESFGHGSAVLGPDGETWYYVYHRLRGDACKNNGDCRRDVWVSPIEFEDRGDGHGDIYIKTRWPADERTVSVTLPP